MTKAIDGRAIVKRQIAWDILPCDEVAPMLPLLGLTPGSAEGHEFEHQLSHRRLERLLPILNAVDVTTDLVAEILTKVTLDDQDPDWGDVFDSGPDVDHYKNLVHYSVLGVLAHLVDSGLVTITEGSR